MNTMLDQATQELALKPDSPPPAEESPKPESSDTPKPDPVAHEQLAAVAAERSDYRRQLRAATLKIAGMEADRLSPADSLKTEIVPEPTPDKGPLAKFLETNADPDEPNPSVPGSIFTEELDHRESVQKQQIADKAADDEAASRKLNFDKSVREARLEYGEANTGEGLDWESVVSGGAQHFTKEDQQHIEIASDPGEEAYNRAGKYLTKAKTPEGEAFRASLQKRLSAALTPAPDPPPKVTEEPEPEKEPTREEVLGRAPRHNAISQLGFASPE